MTNMPKDFADALKESGLAEFFWVSQVRTGGNIKVDYRGKTAGDKKGKNKESSENAFRQIC